MKPNLVQWLKICWSVGVATLLSTMLFLFVGCTFPLTPPVPSEQSDLADAVVAPGRPLTLNVGIALLESSGLMTLTTHPIHAITSTRQLTDSNAVTTLSKAYTGTVRLEMALLYTGTADNPNQWQLVYVADNRAVQNSTTWYEYLLYRVASTGSEKTTTESTRMVLGAPYGIVNTLPLSPTTADGSQPVTLAAWVDTLIQATGSDYPVIARLLFSVETNGETRRVLYASQQKEDGTFLSPDVTVCATNREGNLICWIISWLTG